MQAESTAPYPGDPGIPPADTASPHDTLLEPPRSIPVVADADVIVCGAGPAGISAAIASARAGARTHLIEVHGCLGGTWTAGQLAWIWDFDKPGLASEITDELTARGARRGVNAHHYAYDIEALKRLLDELCAADGVRVRLFTRVVGAHVDEQEQLRAIVTESKSGREAWRAGAFVDATGDGDLAALAGCTFEVGEPGTGRTQPMTYMALIAVQDATQLSACISFWQGCERHMPAVETFRAELARAGLTPSYGHPTLFQVGENVLALMINHEYGVSALDANQITRATLRGRAEVNAVVDGLRALGGPWQDLQLVATAEQIGIREARRVRGLYTVTQRDLVAGRRHADAVCHVSFGVDVHALDPSKDTSLSNMGVRMQPYDIPLRALVARDVDGLLLAGRCISGDFIAHASYRVTGNAVATGQAAGILAAVAAKSGALPREVPWATVQRELARQGWSAP
jgi:hypothetical protein